jgi:hypothetical protein
MRNSEFARRLPAGDIPVGGLPVVPLAIHDKFKSGLDRGPTGGWALKITGQGRKPGVPIGFKVTFIGTVRILRVDL